MTLNENIIRFSQKTIGKRFYDGKDVKSKYYPSSKNFNEDVVPIEVVQISEYNITLDNRRLYNFRKHYPGQQIVVRLKVSTDNVPSEDLDQERFRAWALWEGTYKQFQGVFFVEFDPRTYEAAVHLRCTPQGPDFPILGKLDPPEVTNALPNISILVSW